MPTQPPRAAHRAAVAAQPRVSAGRFLAVGAAATITCLAVGGAVGILPGSALGDSVHRSADSTRPAPQSGTRANGSSDGRAAEQESSRGGVDAALSLPARSAGTQAPDTSSGLPPLTGLPAASGAGKRIVYDISQQQVWLVDTDDSVERTYRVSGGRYDNLSPGSYQVFQRNLHTSAFDNAAETMNYMVSFAHGANALIGFHDVPRYSDGSLAQTKAQLGQRLSAGCIRQWEPDAQALWGFAAMGTPVEVLT